MDGHAHKTKKEKSDWMLERPQYVDWHSNDQLEAEAEEHLQRECHCVASTWTEPPDGLLRDTRDGRCFGRCFGRFFYVFILRLKGNEGHWSFFRNSSAEEVRPQSAGGSAFILCCMTLPQEQCSHHQNPRLWSEPTSQTVPLHGRDSLQETPCLFFLFFFFRRASSHWVKPK